MSVRKLFYIQNKGYCGNCLIWWRRGGHGYTCNLDDAWKVSRKKADEICRVRETGEDVAWPADVIDSASKRHVTSSGISEIKRGAAE